MSADTTATPLDGLGTENYVSIVQETVRQKTGKYIDIDHVKISAISVVERKTNGFLGAYYTLRITIEPTDQSANTSFVYFVKTLPLNNPSAVQFMKETGMADREHNTYTILMTALDSLSARDAASGWHPNCYFRNDDLLVLEDLGDEGYKNVPKGLDFNTDHCQATLATLAALHASSLAYEQCRLNGSTLEEKHSNILTEISFVTNNTWFVVGLKTIADLVPLLSNFKTDLAQRWNRSPFEDHLQGIYEIVKPSKHYRNVLVHQDMWSSNIMFQQTTSSIHAKLIDFQCMRYLPPAADIMLLLHLTTRRAHREAHLAHYLAFYYANLKRNLSGYGLDANDLLPMFDLQTSCKTFRFLALVNAGILLPWIHMPENSLQDLKVNDYKAYQHIAYVHRVDYLVDLMARDKQYEELVQEVVGELVEWVYEQNTYSNI